MEVISTHVLLDGQDYLVKIIQPAPEAPKWVIATWKEKEHRFITETNLEIIWAFARAFVLPTV